MIRVLFLVALILLLGLGVAEAAEKRCDELGAACVCARTLSASSWIRNEVSGRGDLWREADQTPNDAKLCGERSGSWAYVSTAGAAAGTSGGLATATGLNGLGAMLDQGLSTNLTPNGTQTASLRGRTGIRYYIRLGSGYQSTNDGSCSNDKYTQLGDYFTAFTTGYTTSNGGGFSPNITPSMVIGKWMRIEHYIENYGMSPTTHTIYFTEVATKVEKSMTVPSRLSQIQLNGVTDVIHKYRAGSCAGTTLMMYTLMATGLAAGQRIGPAAEVESGGTVPPPTVTYTLTASAQGAGTVTGAGSYPSGTVVTPVAHAASGSTFSEWSGDCAGSGACTVTMSANKAVTATFTTPTTPPPTTNLPPSPSSPTVTLGTQDATGPTFNVAWPAVASATSYSYTAGLSDNSANRQGTVTPPNLLLKMPYMANGAAGSGFVCVRSVNAAGSSEEAACNSLQIPAKPAVIPPPLTTGTLAVDAQITRCNYFLTAEPPDATGGWVAQFYRDGSNKVGNPISAAPYKRSVELYAPSHSFSVQFTKTGSVMRSPAVVTRVCP